MELARHDVRDDSWKVAKHETVSPADDSTVLRVSLASQFRERLNVILENGNCIFLIGRTAIAFWEAALPSM